MHVLWFCIAIVIVLLFFYSVFPNLLTRVFHSYGVYKGPNEKKVALTFDDGPNRKYTGEILDRLREANVKATFFVLAKEAANAPEIIHRMIAEGHDVQIHGMTHLFVPALSIYKSKEQIHYAAAILRDKYGIKTSFYRPTWGLWNLSSLVWAKMSGHKIITWSVMVGDWRVTEPETLVKKIMHKLSPGAVIVLHDSDKSFGAERNAPLGVIHALPELITKIHSQGYEFVTVSKWLGEG